MASGRATEEEMEPLRADLDRVSLLFIGFLTSNVLHYMMSFISLVLYAKSTE